MTDWLILQENVYCVFNTEMNKSQTELMLTDYISFYYVNNVRYPAALKLYGRDLPWVTNATHLGHQLHQSGTMEQDCRVHRAQFISKSLEVREQLHFAKAC